MLAKKARSLYAQAAVSHAREMLSQAGFYPAWLVSSFFVLWFRITASRLD
jgi:hypothetical protein